MAMLQLHLNVVKQYVDHGVYICRHLLRWKLFNKTALPNQIFPLNYFL